jgi:hypothetical protein
MTARFFFPFAAAVAGMTEGFGLRDFRRRTKAPPTAPCFPPPAPPC